MSKCDCDGGWDGGGAWPLDAAGRHSLASGSSSAALVLSLTGAALSHAEPQLLSLRLNVTCFIPHSSWASREPVLEACRVGRGEGGSVFASAAGPVRKREKINCGCVIHASNECNLQRSAMLHVVLFSSWVLVFVAFILFYKLTRFFLLSIYLRILRQRIAFIKLKFFGIFFYHREKEDKTALLTDIIQEAKNCLSWNTKSGFFASARYTYIPFLKTSITSPIL